MATKRYLSLNMKTNNSIVYKLKLKRRLAITITKKNQRYNNNNTLSNASLSSASFPATSSSMFLSSTYSTINLTHDELIEMRRLSEMLPLRLHQQVDLKSQKKLIAVTSSKSSSLFLNSPLNALKVVKCAAKYINQLTATVIARVQNGTLPKGKLIILKNELFVI